MKVKTLSALAGLGGALIMSHSANASYVGLVVVLEASGQATTAGARDVYRVYAQFTSANDRVNAISGDAVNSMEIRNVLADGTTLGSGFQNFGAPTAVAPFSAGTARDWDTYATIGVRYGNEAPYSTDATTLSPGFPSFIVGASLSANNAAYFITPADAQGAAGYRVNGNDTATRVLLMQLVVNVGQHVKGTINVDGQVSTALDGLQVFSAFAQTFSSIIPAPGALALLGLAGLVGTRRRRA